MSYEHHFLFSLLLTIIIEIPIAIFFIKYLYQQREIKISKIILISFLASALTLPYFWFVLPAYIFERRIYIFSGEILIIFIETIIYKQLLKLKFSEAFTVSLITNIGSIFLGLAFQ